MAELDPAPTETGGSGGGMDPEMLNYLAELFGGSAEVQKEVAQIGVQGVLDNTKLGQDFLKQGADYYKGSMDNYAWPGYRALGDLETLSKPGNLPQFQWDKKFDYAPYEWNKEWNYTPWDKELKYQTWNDFASNRLGPQNIKNSPFYDLYQFQNDQQQSAIEAAQRARGGFKTGAAMKEALAKSTGLEQQFTADEYNRALAEYATKTGQQGDEYSKAMQTWAANTDLSAQKYSQDFQDYLTKHSIGYSEASDKYTKDWDQELKKYMLQYGLKQDELNNVRQMVNMGFTADQAIANAKMGAATTSGQMQAQAGSTLANIYSQLGSGLGGTYNAQANLAGNLYNAGQNRNLTASLANQAQNNWQWTNGQNQGLGYANLAAGLARTGLNAYGTYANSGANNSGNLSGGFYGNSFDPSTGTTWGYSGTGADAGVGFW